MTLKLTLTWLWLVLLTCLSVALVSSGWPAERVLLLALLTVVLKNQQVVDRFMSLKRAPIIWRGIMQLYTLLICVLIYVLTI